jgi:hypothetical protein
LATSTTIGDIANVGTASTGSPFYFDFDENDTYDMANATNYVIVLEVNYTSYDGSNYIGIGEDRSTPTHGGNRSSSLNGGSSWSPDSAADLRFSVTSNGMRVTGINRSNPSTFEETGLSQLTLIYIPVTLEVTTENQVGNAIEGVRVRIEETNGTLIAEGSTDSSGVFQYTTYDYDVTGGDVDVNIIARLRGYKYVSTTSTITIDGMTVPFTLLRDEAVFLP